MLDIALWASLKKDDINLRTDFLEILLSEISTTHFQRLTESAAVPTTAQLLLISQ